MCPWRLCITKQAVQRCTITKLSPAQTLTQQHWFSGILCSGFFQNICVIIALGKITDFCFATMQSDPLRNDISGQAPVLASIISPWIHQSTWLVSVPANGARWNYRQGNLTWKWKRKRNKYQQILVILDKGTDCANLPNLTTPVKTQTRASKKEQRVGFVGTFEEHFAVTLSTVSPLAKEMPFTGTLKIIKHIMDITVTLWLVFSFVWVWLLQLRPY